MLALVLAIGSALLAANARPASCLNPEPAVVHLSGMLERITYPGPPNYESISSGDAPETYLVLKADRDICLVDAPTEFSERIQLVFLNHPQESYASLAPSVGKRVTCSGSLFARETGHHHTSILITVSRCAASN